METLILSPTHVVESPLPWRIGPEAETRFQKFFASDWAGLVAQRGSDEPGFDSACAEEQASSSRWECCQGREVGHDGRVGALDLGQRVYSRLAHWT